MGYQCLGEWKKPGLAGTVLGGWTRPEEGMGHAVDDQVGSTYRMG